MTTSEPTLEAGLALGPLDCLARLLAAESTADTPAGRILDEFAAELDVGGLAWLPEGGPAVGSARFRPKEVDWSLVHGMQPGELVDLSLGARRRAPRLVARRDWEVLVCVPAGDHPAGVLRLHAAVPLALDAHQLAALARLVAAVIERSDPRRAARKLRERRLARRAAGLTHDLRNQLTLALMQLERLRDGGAEHAAADLERTLSEARALCARGLVGDGDHATPTRLRAVGLRALLLEEAQAAGQLARRGARDVDVHCASPTRVLVDAKELRRVLRNLLTNALEATPAAGRVTVQVRLLPTGDTEVVVSDQGRGMDADELERLFAPGRSASGGTGYGTAGLFDALTELDAELVVESARGAGTRARVRLASAPATGAAPLLLIDPDERRRARRARDLRTWSLDRGRGREILAVRGPRQALRIASGVELVAVVVARGTAGPELGELRARCAAEGVAWHVISAGDRTPQRPRQAGRERSWSAGG